MNLSSSCLFLVAGLFLCSSALTPEECQPLVTPLSMADTSMMHGRSNFFMGYTHHQAFIELLKLTDSSWIKFDASDKPNRIVMIEENKMNGKCFGSSVNITIDDNTATTDNMMSSMLNVTSAFHLLPTCDSCLVFSINTTASNLSNLSKFLNMTTPIGDEEINVHSLYLLGKESTMKDSDIEKFKQQASCFGFSKEPDFVYDTKNEFCAEGEGIRIH